MTKMMDNKRIGLLLISSFYAFNRPLAQAHDGVKNERPNMKASEMMNNEQPSSAIYPYYPQNLKPYLPPEIWTPCFDFLDPVEQHIWKLSTNPELKREDIRINFPKSLLQRAPQLLRKLLLFTNTLDIARFWLGDFRALDKMKAEDLNVHIYALALIHDLGKGDLKNVDIIEKKNPQLVDNIWRYYNFCALIVYAGRIDKLNAALALPVNKDNHNIEQSQWIEVLVWKRMYDYIFNRWQDQDDLFSISNFAARINRSCYLQELKKRIKPEFAQQLVVRLTGTALEAGSLDVLDWLFENYSHLMVKKLGLWNTATCNNIRSLEAMIWVEAHYDILEGAQKGEPRFTEWAFYYAIEDNDMARLKWVMEHSDVEVNISMISKASKLKHMDMLDYLYSRKKDDIGCYSDFKDACESRSFEVMEFWHKSLDHKFLRRDLGNLLMDLAKENHLLELQELTGHQIFFDLFSTLAQKRCFTNALINQDRKTTSNLMEELKRKVFKDHDLLRHAEGKADVLQWLKTYDDDITCQEHMNASDTSQLKISKARKLFRKAYSNCFSPT